VYDVCALSLMYHAQGPHTVTALTCAFAYAEAQNCLKNVKTLSADLLCADMSMTLDMLTGVDCLKGLVLQQRDCAGLLMTVIDVPCMYFMDSLLG